MRFTRTTVAAGLVLAACSTSVPAEPKAFELGSAFQIRVGEQAQTADNRWRVGLDGVLSDSRCPKGEQCMWQGDAIVRVWVQQGAGPRQVRELHAMAGAAQSAAVLGQEVRLVRLEPVPVTGRAILQGDYIVTILLGRGAPVEADR